MKLHNLGILVGLLALASPASAHFIWLTIDPNGAQAVIELADSPGKDIAPILYQLQPRMELTGLNTLIDAKNHERMTATITSPKKPIAIGALFGVFENALVHWSAKAVGTRVQAGVPIGMKGEILLKQIRDGWRASVTLNGKPMPDVQVEIYSDNGKPLFAKTDRSGSISLPQLKGLVQIGAMILEPISGTYSGKKYAQKVEACSLSFRS